MSASLIGPVEKEQYETQGYVVLKNVFRDTEIERMKMLYELRWVELVSNQEITQDPNAPVASLFPRIYNYDRENPELLRYVLDDRIMDSLEELMGEEALLIATSYFFKGPGMKGLPLHQDDLVFGIEPGTVYSVWLSLDDADQENGCMQFVPGTQHLKTLLPEKDQQNDLSYFSDDGRGITVPEEYRDRVVDVPTASGDLVIFNGYIIHGSYDNNSSNRFRRALLMQFAGVQTEKLLPNFNNLLNRKGERVRKRLNTNPLIVGNEKSVFSAKEGKYFDHTGWVK
ncbi:phytanoyl-CoA dioxygenase family protein [Brevibacillus migulae]|uniref:phytanoyl-CoA dioxygenase family protein n=1 Tax=Brevibacillus migulae TaxID=1644114 RepID=UPI00106E7542|nr:phytanoyl-CoA dioxygenase family protein [Brevibacillus migulae]